MLAPYETISEEEYNSRVAKMPKIDWAKLYLYEKEDMTDLHQQTACTGGGCEV
jgi:ribonucleoside-diphosphate reductase alpha chain